MKWLMKLMMTGDEVMDEINDEGWLSDGLKWW
jgi:hypothetical protein